MLWRALGREVFFTAAIAQLGERQTEDLEVPSSILGHGTFPRLLFHSYFVEGIFESKFLNLGLCGNTRMVEKENEKFWQHGFEGVHLFGVGARALCTWLKFEVCDFSV